MCDQKQFIKVEKERAQFSERAHRITEFHRMF
jgi:hypothetical protein